MNPAGRDAAFGAALAAACEELAAGSGRRAKGVRFVEVAGRAVALKAGRRRGLRGALLAVGLARSRSARAAGVARRLAAAGVATPEVLAVHRCAGGADVLAMERLEGRDLAQALVETPDAQGAGLDALLGEAGALVAALHAARVVHRDLKASNLFVAEDARVHVLDLDGARRVRRLPGDRRRAADLARLVLSVELAGHDPAPLFDGYARRAGWAPRALAAARARVARLTRAKRARNARRGRALG